MHKLLLRWIQKLCFIAKLYLFMITQFLWTHTHSHEKKLVCYYSIYNLFLTISWTSGLYPLFLFPASTGKLQTISSCMQLFSLRRALLPSWTYCMKVKQRYVWERFWSVWSSSNTTSVKLSSNSTLYCILLQLCVSQNSHFSPM